MNTNNAKTIKLFWLLQIGQVIFLFLFFLLAAITMLLAIRHESLIQIGREMKKRNIILQLTLMEGLSKDDAPSAFPLPHPTEPDAKSIPPKDRYLGGYEFFDGHEISYYGKFDVLRAMEERLKIACDLTDTRFTVFSPLGSISYDTRLDPGRIDEKKAKMRPEFFDAVLEGSGLEIRIDEQTGEKMIHQTLPLYVKNELIGVTRVSQAYELAKELRSGIINTALRFILLTLVIISGGSFLFIRKISTMFLKMESTLSYISNGDYAHRLSPFKIRELNSLATTINEMSEKLKDQNSRLEALTMMDELTGLGNRRMFNQKLDYCWWMCVREKQPISFLILDIDKFKQYNDTLGHPEGDNCLRKVGQILKSSIKRHTDVLTRVGGEEFGVLLPGSDEKQAGAAGEMLLRKINNANIPHPSSSVTDHVTLSIGLATLYPNAYDDMNRLFMLADKALYRAKENGRNRLET